MIFTNVYLFKGQVFLLIVVDVEANITGQELKVTTCYWCGFEFPTVKRFRVSYLKRALQPPIATFTTTRKV